MEHFFYPVTKKMSAVLKMCVQKQSSSSLKDSILIMLPTSFSELVQLDLVINFFFEEESMDFFSGFKRQKGEKKKTNTFFI